jgi:outer membrane lipoprotein SlyB
MRSVVGVFQSRSAAGEGIERLLAAGLKREHINVLTPASSDEQIAAVPVSDSEQPGMGGAAGALVGGALGSALGVTAGAALASLLVPGVGPIFAGSLLGGGLLGLSGAVGGAAAGDALEERVSGLPRDEMYVYEDALRQGRTVLIAEAEDEWSAEAARQVLAEAGAESVDRAREDWWIGLRSAEQESYTADGGDFEGDEPYYRTGFEAAQSPETRGKSYDEALDYLTQRYQAGAQHPAFRKGYERGRRYSEDVRDQISYSGGLGRPKSM